MIGRILNWFGADGMAHALCCLLVCALSGAFLPVWAAVLLGILVGAGKELVWDKWLGKGHASWHDFLCDLAGVVLGLLVCIAYTI